MGRVECFSLAMETMDPKKLEFPQVSHAREGASGGMEGLVSWEEISHTSDNLPDHLAGQTRTNRDGWGRILTWTAEPSRPLSIS